MRVIAAVSALGLGLLTLPACGNGNAARAVDGGVDDASNTDARSSGDAGADAGADAEPSLGPETLPPGYPNLDLSAVGATGLRVVTPTLLELELVTTKAADPAPVGEWSFVDASGQGSALPAPSTFVVHAGGATIA